VLLSSCIHALIYAASVWLVGRAGSVFAAQVSYLVTGFGVLWAMALLGERYGAGFWLALGLMFAGLFLVQPRPARPDLAAAAPDRGRPAA
jgi:drug/metabolite transporter (DMT)-like permease